MLIDVLPPAVRFGQGLLGLFGADDGLLRVIPVIVFDGQVARGDLVPELRDFRVEQVLIVDSADIGDLVDPAGDTAIGCRECYLASRVEPMKFPLHRFHYRLATLAALVGHTLRFRHSRE